MDFNAGPLVRESLESIVFHPPHSVVIDRIVVVDNASSHPTADFTGGLDLPLRLIRNERNLGFAAACNQGASGSASNYLLFLNPDTRLLDGSLDVPVTFFEAPGREDLGVTGIQLLDERGNVSRSCFRFPRTVYFLNQILGLNYLSPVQFRTVRMAEWDHSETRQVDQIMGAFFLVRRRLFESLGGFDERFFVYFEEMDFSYRAWKSGFRSYYLAEGQAFHKGWGTTEAILAERLFYSLRSRLQYGFKHFSRIQAVILLMLTLFLEPISRLVLAVTRRSWKEIVATVRAYSMLWSSLYGLIRKK